MVKQDYIERAFSLHKKPTYEEMIEEVNNEKHRKIKFPDRRYLFARKGFVLSQYDGEDARRALDDRKLKELLIHLFAGHHGFKVHDVKGFLHGINYEPRISQPQPPAQPPSQPPPSTDAQMYDITTPREDIRETIIIAHQDMATRMAQFMTQSNTQMHTSMQQFMTQSNTQMHTNMQQFMTQIHHQQQQTNQAFLQQINQHVDARQVHQHVHQAVDSRQIIINRPPIGEGQLAIGDGQLAIEFAPAPRATSSSNRDISERLDLAASSSSRGQKRQGGEYDDEERTQSDRTIPIRSVIPPAIAPIALPNISIVPPSAPLLRISDTEELVVPQGGAIALAPESSPPARSRSREKFSDSERIIRDINLDIRSIESNTRINIFNFLKRIREGNSEFKARADEYERMVNVLGLNSQSRVYELIKAIEEKPEKTKRPESEHPPRARMRSKSKPGDRSSSSKK